MYRRFYISAFFLTVLTGWILSAGFLNARSKKEKPESPEGTVWEVTFEPLKGDEEDTFKDVLSFQGDKVVIEKLRSEGFKPGRYKFGVNRKTNTAGFTVTLKSRSSGSVFMEGAFTGEEVKGKMIWRKRSGTQEFYFFGKKKKLEDVEDAKTPELDGTTWLISVTNATETDAKPFPEKIEFVDGKLHVKVFQKIKFGSAACEKKKKENETRFRSVIEGHLKSRLSIQGVVKGHKIDGMITLKRPSSSKMYMFKGHLQTAGARKTLNGSKWNVVFNHRGSRAFSGTLFFAGGTLYLSTEPEGDFRPASFKEEVKGMTIEFASAVKNSRGGRVTIKAELRENKIEGEAYFSYGKVSKYPIFGTQVEDE